VDVSVVRLKAQ